jgi:hypothetical protein
MGKLKIFVRVTILLVVVIVVFLFATCNSADCSSNKGEIMEFGDFKYCYIDKAGSSVMLKDGKYVAVLELTKQGKDKETIIIPDYIDDKPVVQIGMKGIEFYYSIGYGIYNKVYLPCGIKSINDTRYFEPNTIKRFFIDLSDLNFLDTAHGKFYLAEELYNKYIDMCGLDAITADLHIANVTYMSNDEVYFIDDYNDGNLINAPIPPICDGYEFMGWYKDSEFQNEWDFENDTFDTGLADPTMVLYAKWRSI